MCGFGTQDARGAERASETVCKQSRRSAESGVGSASCVQCVVDNFSLEAVTHVCTNV